MKVFIAITSYLFSNNSAFKEIFNSSEQYLSFKELDKTFNINLVKHGDKSNVNNLYKDITPLVLSCAEITNWKIALKSDNFFSIVGFIIVLFIIYFSFISDKCFSQHISVYLFLS